MNLSHQQIKTIFSSKNYILFDKPDLNFNLNLFGVRMDSEKKQTGQNTYNDFFYCLFYKDKLPHIIKYSCTVDPGTEWLLNPMDKGGTAAIYEGQYPGLWTIGKFHNYLALIQKTPIKVYRDNNKNNVFDYDPNNTTTGNYGIFCHQHYQGLNEANIVGNSSAGCVVFKKTNEFDHIIELCYKQINNKLGNSFTFTLFNINDIVNCLNPSM